ncbi:MAG TPA: S26 family signal peptidase [Streptosporangiaceae bacterium]|nr:S26 family signal peptidase [Streptosporangiaceae bacterium]
MSWLGRVRAPGSLRWPGRVRWPLWPVAVVDRSMEPTLRPGDWLLVRRTVRPGRTVRVRPGRLVVARHPGQPDMLVVKRVAGRVPGGWWLEAENLSAGAADSATFGPVPPELVEGSVLGRYRRGPGRPLPPPEGATQG